MDCPSTERLRHLCTEMTGDDGEETLVAHVNACEECQGELRDIADGLAADALPLENLAWVVNSQALQERLDALKLQRRSPHPQHALQYEDLRPWIQEGDTEIGSIDHYDLVRCIGRGGMGVVFEALDRQLRRPVAIKVMSPALLVDPTNSERFFREARAAAAINCASVVSIHSVAKIRDLPYLSMELVEGESLQQFLERDEELRVERAIEIATQIAEGLQAAHATGVIHRDIKPSNVLISTKTGLVKLTDFGLAHQVSENPLTETGSLLGTPEYLAPEQILGNRADERSDLFSLGSVLYRMCAGRNPFTASALVATLHQVITCDPAPLADQDPRVPIWLSDLIGRLHEKDPENRIQSADTVVRALTQHRLEDATPSRPRSTDQSQALFALGSVVFLAIAIALLWTFSSVDDKPTRGMEGELWVARDTNELLELLSDQEGDLTIKLRAGETYDLDPVELLERNVCLEASPGPAPRLVFADRAEQAALSCVHGRLELQGLQIESVAPTWEDYGDAPLIRCEFGSLLMLDCDVVGERRGAIQLIESDGEIAESHLDTQFDAIVLATTRENTLAVRDSTLVSDVGIRFEADSTGNLELTNAKFDNRCAIELDHAPDRETPISIKSIQNEFACDESILVIHSEEPARPINEFGPASLPIRWSSNDTVESDITVTLFREDSPPSSFLLQPTEGFHP
ncbi:MAG: serine/threonine-protein kinase [Planctomycetota bacterium]